MSDKNKPDLETENAALRKQLAELENVSLKKRIAELEVARGGDAQIRLKVASIKSKAKVTEDGEAKMYRVGEQGHYREGRMYAAGEVVRIPLEQDPSHTFEPVVDAEDEDLADGERIAPTGGAGKQSGGRKGKSPRASELEPDQAKSQRASDQDI